MTSDLIELALSSVDGRTRGLQVLHARPCHDEPGAGLRLLRPGRGLRDVFLSLAVLELVERLLGVVALRDGPAERRIGVVRLGLGDGPAQDQPVGAIGVELRLVDRDLQGDEARVGPLDLLASRPVLGFFERGGRGLGFRPRLLNLLGPRPLFELLQVRLRLLELRLRLQALRFEVARFQREQLLPRGHAIALVNEDLFHPPARARADRDGPRLDGAAPLVRARRLIRTEAEVGRERHREDEERHEAARAFLLRRRLRDGGGGSGGHVLAPRTSL